MRNSHSQNLVIERIIRASSEKIWKAWTEPEHFKQWWGIESVLTYCTMDVRSGGTYLLCMETPDHAHHWYTGTYQKVEPYTLLEYTDSFADSTGRIVPASHYGYSANFPLVMSVTLELEAIGDKTKLRLTQSGFPSQEIYRLTRNGWDISLGNLTEYLQMV